MRVRAWAWCWLLGLLLAVQLAGWAPGSDQARIDPFPGTKAYTSPHGWSLRYPGSWEATADTLSDSPGGYFTWIADGDGSSGRIQVIESTATAPVPPTSPFAGYDIVDILRYASKSATTSTVTTRAGIRADTMAAQTGAGDAYFVASLSVGQTRYLLNVLGPWERRDELQRVFDVAVASFNVER